MKITVRFWVVDHWTQWQPADGPLRASISESEFAALWQGDTIDRYAGIQQIQASDRQLTEQTTTASPEKTGCR